MLDKLKEAFSQLPKKDVFKLRKRRVIGAGRIPSAVLVPLFVKNGEYYLLFTRRTDNVKVHRGEISFPGGVREFEDLNMLDTALRECKEEIGLKADDIEVLGELDDTPTIGTNYLITPFVAAIPWPYKFKTDPKEVEEIIEVPLMALMDRNSLRHETDTVDGKLITTYFYSYKGRVIWGATARILNQFLDIYSKVQKNTRK